MERVVARRLVKSFGAVMALRGVDVTRVVLERGKVAKGAKAESVRA